MMASSTVPGTPFAQFAGSVHVLDAAPVHVRDAPAARMQNVLLVAPERVVADAVREYPVPALLILKFENVATPLTAAADSVPPSVPFAGFVPMASGTVFVADVTVVPLPSTMRTCTAG